MKDVNEQWRSKLRGNKVVGWGLDDDEEEGGVTSSNGGVGSGISSSISSDRNNGGSSGGTGGSSGNGFADTDLRLCRLLQGCMQEDIQADRIHALSGAGNMLHPINTPNQQTPSSQLLMSFLTNFSQYILSIHTYHYMVLSRPPLPSP